MFACVWNTYETCLKSVQEASGTYARYVRKHPECICASAKPHNKAAARLMYCHILFCQTQECVPDISKTNAGCVWDACAHYLGAELYHSRVVKWCRCNLKVLVHTMFGWLQLSTSYSAVVMYIGITEVYTFSQDYIAQKIAPLKLHDTSAILVRYKQVQKYL